MSILLLSLCAIGVYAVYTVSDILASLSFEDIK